jgi:hypothetical protein
VKEWRRKKGRLKTGSAHLSQSMIQDTIPPAKPYQRLVLLIPETKAGVIQDEIRLLRVDNITFAAYGP